MAYDVTKVVNGRPYRYRVQSERDAASGKTRNRWTYLGRGDVHGAPAAAKPRVNARERLLDALERLLDRSDPGDVTAAAVSVEAGLAHGTFYRYFKNRNDAIRALTDRLRSEHAADVAALDEPATGVAGARAALRTWTRAMLLARTRHHGLIRALLTLAAQDDEMRAALRARRERYAHRLAEWLRELADRGFASLAEPEVAGAVLYSMLDGIGREAVLSGEPISEAQANVAIDLVERAIFGTVS